MSFAAVSLALVQLIPHDPDQAGETVLSRPLARPSQPNYTASTACALSRLIIRSIQAVTLPVFSSNAVPSGVFAR